MQRDSIGDNNVGEYDTGRMGLMQQTPNFYEFPTNSKNQDGLNTIGMQGSSYDNQINRFSPKVQLGQDNDTGYGGGVVT